MSYFKRHEIFFVKDRTRNFDLKTTSTSDLKSAEEMRIYLFRNWEAKFIPREMATQSTIINIVAESRNVRDEPVLAQMQSVE